MKNIKVDTRDFAEVLDIFYTYEDGAVDTFLCLDYSNVTYNYYYTEIYNTDDFSLLVTGKGREDALLNLEKHLLENEDWFNQTFGNDTARSLPIEENAHVS